MITNILHHLAGPGQVIRQLTVFDVFSEDIAQDTPEIFVTGEREETPGVGKHTDEP